MNQGFSSGQLLGSSLMKRHRGGVSAPSIIRRTFFDFSQTTKNVANTGSVARDLLAAERTFLAWGRTGLGFVGAGSAMFAAYHQTPSQTGIRTDVLLPSGVLVANGTFLLLFATRRYVRVCEAIQSNMFPLDTRATFFAVIVTAVGTVTSLGLIMNTELIKKIDEPSAAEADTATPSAKKLIQPYIGTESSAVQARKVSLLKL